VGRDGYTVIDLFCAPGGLSLGFEMAGFRVLAGVDIDPDGMKTYSRNFPHAVPVIADIRQLDPVRFMETVGAAAGRVDVVVGGPPCQGFSTIGRSAIAGLARKGVKNGINVLHPRFIDDPRNELYRYFIRFVKALQPRAVVMENVPGMMSYRDGAVVREIIEDFASLGYRVTARVLNAADYGVPQLRKRIFFLGVRGGNAVLRFPAPTNIQPEGLGTELGLKPYITVWEAIGDLPEIPAGGGAEEMPYTKPPHSEYARWAREGSPAVFNHRARHHNERDIQVFSLMKEGQWWKDLPKEIKRMFNWNPRRDAIFQDKVKKLARDKPSWTVISHLYKDGYSYVHPTQPRTITVREAARLQGFPDRFIFMGSRTSQFRQVGNAVPPLLAKAIADTVGAILSGM
jgi:DNA (cytosine-5)-methyltransferase 1